MLAYYIIQYFGKYVCNAVRDSEQANLRVEIPYYVDTSSEYDSFACTQHQNQKADNERPKWMSQ